MDDRLASAVVDNARWCHLVCSTNGIVGRFDEDAWVGPRRTPPMYPDAVTLRGNLSIEALLSRIDATAGCSIKDSFSALDLTAEGFEALFDAQWLWRSAAPRPAASALSWERVERPDDLRSWSLEHGGRSTFSPALLDEPSVTILAARDVRGDSQPGRSRPRATRRSASRTCSRPAPTTTRPRRQRSLMSSPTPRPRSSSASPTVRSSATCPLMSWRQHGQPASRRSAHSASGCAVADPRYRQ